MTINRKRFVTEDDLKAAKPEELTDLIFEKATTNPEGSTAVAARFRNIELLHEGDWSKKELKKHRSGKPKGAYGVARRVVRRLAPSCSNFEELIAAMRREAGAGQEVADIEHDDEVVVFDDKGLMKNVSFKTLRDYFREEKSGK